MSGRGSFGTSANPLVTGAKLVKGFHHLIAATLASDPVVEGGHRVVFLSSDDEEAIAPVAALAKRLGFAPVKLGKLPPPGVRLSRMPRRTATSQKEINLV